MQLYHASLGSEPDGICTHFGSLMAAMHRAETIFAQRETRLLIDGRFHVVGPAWELGRVNGSERLRRIETPQEHLRAFASYLNQISVYRVTLGFNKLLPLQDCWDDDPIGSGGLKILGSDPAITDSERMELTKVFYPFSDIIYPQDIQFQLKPSDINRMQREICKNGIFSKQLARRRAKLGEVVYALDRPAEVVWQFMTMKLRAWALGKGYDGFSYLNSQEGDGDTTFVSLRKDSIKSIEAFSVDGDAFFQAISPINVDSLQTRLLKRDDGRAGSNNDVVVSDFWNGINILEFLKPRTPSSSTHGNRLRRAFPQ